MGVVVGVVVGDTEGLERVGARDGDSVGVIEGADDVGELDG